MLRHSNNKPAPAWTAGCIGPFLAFSGLFAAGGILLGHPLAFANGVALVVAVAPAALGAWMTIDQHRNK